MKVKYYGHKLEIVGNADELKEIDFGDSAPEATLTVDNNWGGVFKLAAQLQAVGNDLEMVDDEPKAAPAPKEKAANVRGPRKTYTADQIAEVVDYVNANQADMGRKTIPSAEVRFGVKAAKIRQWMAGEKPEN